MRARRNQLFACTANAAGDQQIPPRSRIGMTRTLTF
jgi:hypothetical protein